MLLERGASPRIADAYQNTPLMAASKLGRFEIAKLLLAHGADPSYADEDGQTAVSCAVAHGFTALADLLRSRESSSAVRLLSTSASAAAAP